MNLVEMILTTVGEKGEVCVSDIADDMQIPASIVADVFKKLESKGLLQEL